MPNPVRAIPEGYHSISPSLTCKNAARAIEFYKSVFGATEVMRMPGPEGKIVMPLENMFWGDRYGKVTDPFGHQWGIAQHVEDVAPQEMKRRQDATAANMAKAAGQN